MRICELRAAYRTGTGFMTAELLNTNTMPIPAASLRSTMTDPSRTTTLSTSDEGEQGGSFPPDRHLPENSQANLDAKLDHAIEETFPTSDPVSVSIIKGGAIDYNEEASPAPESSTPSGEQSAEAVLQQVRGAALAVSSRRRGHRLWDRLVGSSTA
jgi:hypothetical protein